MKLGCNSEEIIWEYINLTGWEWNWMFGCWNLVICVWVSSMIRPVNVNYWRWTLYHKVSVCWKEILPENNLYHQHHHSGRGFCLVSVLLWLNSQWTLAFGHLLSFVNTAGSSGNHLLEVDFLQSLDFCVKATFLPVQVAGMCQGNKFQQRAGLSILVKTGSHHPGNDSVFVLNTRLFITIVNFKP